MEFDENTPGSPQSPSSDTGTSVRLGTSSDQQPSPFAADALAPVPPSTSNLAMTITNPLNPDIDGMCCVAESY